MIREIVKIDEDLCNGCGLCIPNCHEGALQIIDDKARLISDLMCDGLGACLGHCPEGAITIEKREAEAYNETKVMEDMVLKGINTVIAHLQHLKDHGESDFLKEGVQYLLQNKSSLEFDLDEVLEAVHNHKVGSENKASDHDQGHHHAPQAEPEAQGCGCAGSATKTFGGGCGSSDDTNVGSLDSALSHWPIQMHLINPGAQHFKKSDLVLAADCVAFSLGAFHQDYLNGKTLAIACPKLDSNMEVYVEKLKTLIDSAEINTLTIMMMEVPCCGGLMQMVKNVQQETQRKIPVKAIIVSVEGKILQEGWL